MSDANLISSVMALLIPIISVTVSLGALIVWIVVWYRRRMHEVDCRHKERMAAIEKGLDLPPESLPPPEQLPPRSRYLLRGLIWLGVGLAITFGGHDSSSISSKGASHRSRNPKSARQVAVRPLNSRDARTSRSHATGNAMPC